MKESEAWLVLASAWSKAKKEWYGYYAVHDVTGLCPAVRWGPLEWDNWLRERMRKRLRLFRPEGLTVGVHWWPPDTLAGKRARVTVCLDLAGMAMADEEE